MSASESDPAKTGISSEFKSSPDSNEVDPPDEIESPPDANEANPSGGVNSPPDVNAKHRWAIWIGLSAIVVLAVAVVGLSIALAAGDSDSDSQPVEENGTPTPVPTLSPVSTFEPTLLSLVNSQDPTRVRKSTIEDIQAYVVSQGVSTSGSVSSQGSPQYRAVSWLANSDLADLPVPTGPASDSDAYIYVARYVLATLFYSTIEDGAWRHPLSFFNSESVCLWNVFGFAGVFCDTDGIPRDLFIDGNGLAGTIPSELKALTTLERLHIARDRGLTGPIPTELCELSLLERLDLGFNNITGPIPDCVDQWPSLEIFDSQSNSMTGVLPVEQLCTLSSLTELHLDYNAFEGQVPECVTSWPNLHTLSISNNIFTGAFPDFGSNRVLEWLAIDDNMLTGDISIFDGLRQIESLYIEDNMFDGVLDTFGMNFPLLLALDMSSNNITSVNGIPEHILDMVSLEVLDLSRNELSGGIAPPVQNPNPSLLFFAAYDNFLSGAIPSELGNLVGLRHLDLTNNDFTGPMPSELGDLVDLTYLFMAGNPGLTAGPVPSTYENLVLLEELSLKETNRIGLLPSFLANLPNLLILDLDNNDFSGEIPAVWGQMDSLGYLLLNRNPNLKGPIPTSFGDMNGLQYFFLDATGVSGSLDVLCGLPAFDDANSDGLVRGLVISDCGANGNTTCTCAGCFCCDKDEDGCSLPQATNLDLQWEYRFGHAPRSFGLNDSAFDNPGND